MQPLRITTQEADSFFDFDIEPESPGSPVDECEYTRLIETAATTPCADVAPESGYVCASPCSTQDSFDSQNINITHNNTNNNSNSSSSNNSSELQYFDPDNSEIEQKSTSIGDYYDCVDNKMNSFELDINNLDSKSTKITTAAIINNDKNPSIANGHVMQIFDSDTSLTESLPPSQSTESTNSTFTGHSSSNSNNTLQDDIDSDLMQDDNAIASKKAEETIKIPNGHVPVLVNNECEISSLEINREYTVECVVESNGQEAGSVDEVDNCEEVINKNETKIEYLTTDQILEGIIKESASYVSKEDKYFAEREAEEYQTKEKLSPVSESEEPEEINVTQKETLSSCETDEEDDRPQRVRRCSSLKSGKTPPGTPGRKKFVRFADVFGLDLADVRTFLDEVPKVPKSAYEDLNVSEPTDTPMEQLSMGPMVDKVLVPLFQQPGGLPCFLEKVRERQVCLENAAVTDPILIIITGCVRVRNLDFNKSVHVRYTLDNWRSFSDLQTTYCPNSCDGFSDKFSFTLYGNSLQVGGRLEMAVRFQCKGQQFWDNNHDSNYCFQCLPASQPQRPSVQIPIALSPPDAWSGAFY